MRRPDRPRRRRTKCSRERPDVILALAQRRQPDRKHIEPVEQIAAELAARRPSIADRRWWPPPAARRRRIVRLPPTPFELLLLQHAQQLRLRLRRHFADFVQEERAADRPARSGPAARVTAPVKAPRSWPNSSLSSRSAGSAAQLTSTSGACRGGCGRGWRGRPVPCRSRFRRAAAPSRRAGPPSSPAA